MKVHCYNYREHLSEIQNILCQALNYPVALHIVKYLVLNYLTQMEEDIEIKQKTHRIVIEITASIDFFGIKYGGSRNYKMGKRKGMHGVFVSEIVPNSAADYYKRLNGFNFTGFEIVRYNNYQLLKQNKNNNIDELKKYIKSEPCCAAYLKLRWNPDLLEKYGYFD